MVHIHVANQQDPKRIGAILPEFTVQTVDRRNFAVARRPVLNPKEERSNIGMQGVPGALGRGRICMMNNRSAYVCSRKESDPTTLTAVAV